MGNASGQSSVNPTRSRTAIVAFRDTMESIVIAFVLAFIFRAFIVEAFVIPTGSMASTLYGQQLIHTCSTCGYKYAVGIPERIGPISGKYEVKLRCPNCYSLTDEFSISEIQRPNSGDRILVYKWPFNLKGDIFGPHRWDVTVFKDPRDGQTNFIKRLVGLPGEVLEVIDGDVYTADMAELKAKRPDLLETLDRLRIEVYRYRHGQSKLNENQILARYREANQELLPFLKIQQKLPASERAMQSLWFNVYNHDYLPNSDQNSPVRWEPTDEAARQAWNTDQREITFNSEQDTYLPIRFTGKPVDDFYAYNNDGVLRGPHGRQRSRRFVGDLRLRFTWFPEADTGTLRLKMNRDKDTFIAEIATDGRVSLTGRHPQRDLPGKKQVIGQNKLPAFQTGQPVKIEFINLDYRVGLKINGEEVIVSTAEQYHPSMDKLQRMIQVVNRSENINNYLRPSQVEIAARNTRCRLRHIVLERDIYYRAQRHGENGNPYHDWPCWGTAGQPILLRPQRQVEGETQPGEYFMLGDNSPASKDSRLWWEIGDHLVHQGKEYQVGTVPGDQLIGKAFFVYWPPGYRPSWASNIGLIPNVGRMRWIR